MLNDINKLITISKKEVQDSKNNPLSYTSRNIDISRQAGFIEERYLYKNDSNLVAKLISSSAKNRLDSVTTGNTTVVNNTQAFNTEKPKANDAPISGTGNTNRLVESVSLSNFFESLKKFSSRFK